MLKTVADQTSEGATTRESVLYFGQFGLLVWWSQRSARRKASR